MVATAMNHAPRKQPGQQETPIFQRISYPGCGRLKELESSVAGGEALQQSGSFSKTTLNGTDILYMSGFDCGGNNCTIDQSNPNSTAGSNTVLAAFPANGSGGVSSGTFYSNSSGMMQSGSL